MRAAYYERQGPAHEVLQVGEVPTPEPGPGDVRVKIAWSGVNPSDVKSRGGTLGMAFPRIIPHSDGAGVIDAVGAGVPASRVGERVWVLNAAWKRPSGTAAEFTVVPSALAPVLPDGIGFAEGACLGIPALTAYHAVHAHGGVRDKRVLVTGGAGAVGHYAVQLARLAGARRVVTTVSGDEKARLAIAAGADATVNYREADAATRIRDAAGGDGIDRVIEVDLAANLRTDIEVLAPDSEIVVYGSGQREIAVPFGPMIMKNVDLRFFIVYHLPPAVRAEWIAGLTALLERGALVHNVAARLPLERIVDAHTLVEQGRAIGNVVVAPAESSR